MKKSIKKKVSQTRASTTYWREPTYYRAQLYRLPLGEKIRVGDYWQTMTKDLVRFDTVGWFTKVSRDHCPIFRLVGFTPVVHGSKTITKQLKCP